MAFTRFKTILAFELKPHDKFRCYGSVCEVATVDITDSFHHDYPQSVHLQIEHPSRGRVAALYYVDDEIELKTTEPAPTRSDGSKLGGWLASLSGNGKPKVRLAAPAIVPRKVRFVAPNGGLKKPAPTTENDTGGNKPRIKRR